MINTKHLLRVTAAWTSIVFVICFLGVALFPGLRDGFMMYALHTSSNLGNNVITFGTFIFGLIIWNIVTSLGVALFAWLFNTIKK